MLHALITALLWYAFVGSVIWMFLDGLGIISSNVLARRASGKPATMGTLVRATLLVIFAWPAFVWLWIKGMRRVSR